MSCCSPLGGGTGPVAITPLSNVWFVDQGAAPAGDGSIAKPYNTLAAALAAHPTGGTFLLTPYDYSAEVIAAPLADGDWSFVGLQLGSWPEGYSGGALPSPSSLTLLPNLTIGTGGNASQVALRSVAMGNLGVQQGCSLVLQDVVLTLLDCTTGPAAGTLLRADRCYFDSSGVGGAGLGDSQFNDCGFFGSQSIQTGGTLLQLTRCFGETSLVFLAAAGVAGIDLWTNGRLTTPAVTNGVKEVQGPIQSITGVTTQDQVDSIVAAGVALGLWTDDR